MLRHGGTAIDAVVAGAFAATVAEPTLAGLGGGGFCLVAEPDGEPRIIDFFVNVPGLGGDGRIPHMESLCVTFGDHAVQDFEVGWGSVAVPGALEGLLALHARGGRLPLADILAPAITAAREGIHLDDVQVRFIRVIGPILTLTPESAALFTPPLEGQAFRNPAYADVLTRIAAGPLPSSAYADPLVAAVQAGGGLLTHEDLRAYRVVERRPVGGRRGTSSLWTNPPPAFGGAIVLETLGLVPEVADPWPAIADALVRSTHRHRGGVRRGTTHLSVIDAEGRVAGLSMSNGSNSGTVVHGVTLNNMLGEADLNPGGWHALDAGTRLRSMMAPTLVIDDDGTRTVLGTGGSERIRSALVQTLVRTLDHGDDLASAVAAPRLHASEALIDVEPGLRPEDSTWTWREGHPPVREWPSRDLYFGGVHAVRRDPDGRVTAVGDHRRGGATAIV